MEILLAEDDVNFGHLLKHELEEEGHHVYLARDGVDAVGQCIERQFDLALLDVLMPRLDGIDALRLIKMLVADMPVIIFSGNINHAESNEARRIGAAACLSKPFTLKALNQEIERHAHASSGS